MDREVAEEQVDVVDREAKAALRVVAEETIALNAPTLVTKVARIRTDR